jgi:hypothetical protein
MCKYVDHNGNKTGLSSLSCMRESKYRDRTVRTQPDRLSEVVGGCRRLLAVVGGCWRLFLAGWHLVLVHYFIQFHTTAAQSPRKQSVQIAHL